MKRLISKIVAPHPLRIDEMMNITTEVEAILNSRPLVAAEGVELEEGLVLTPAHFIIYRPMKSPPTAAATKAKIPTLKRCQLVQRLSQKLEEEWKGNYLQSLQARKQWKNERCNIKEKDIVFVKDETIATGRWPLGIITKVFPGKDNLVRTVNVKVRGKEYKRSIHMMVPLLMEDDK